MIAVDTNVIVRLVTNDEPRQARAAAALFRTQRLWISKSVLLETEWVLRYTYELGRGAIQEVLRRLLGFSGAHVEDRRAVVRAVDWHAAGLDFADALHLASTGDAERFATFDRKLAGGARRCQGTPVVESLRPTGDLEPV